MQLKRTSVVFFALSLLLMAALACSFSPFGDNSAGNEAAAAVQVLPTLQPTAEPPQAPQSIQNAPVSNQQDITALDLEQKLIDLYAQVNPAVVHILVYTGLDEFVPLGSGSGFVYSQDGYIVTNNHVVEEGREFEVVFFDGSRRRAEVIGADVDSDLAVIKVDSIPESARVISLGDSDQLRVGQLVIAIGNPFGEQGSMSMGIVSGLGRSLESQRQLDGSGGRYSLPQVIQTDAPINPGNSGGPLIDLDGQVVGINSAIRSTTGVNSGVGFSIPVNAVTRIIPKLIADGEYIYSYMGVQIQSLNLNTQDLFGLPQVQGAYVTGVTEGGPAADAGLIPADLNDGTGGDLIVAIDGEPILDTESLIAYLVFHTEVGQTIDLSVIRGGETISVPLTLGARP
ncbi:MAG: trypsin-like peptidase domain-containing protein [Chloroflexota bacterium]|jgi:2-alkenal reductase